METGTQEQWLLARETEPLEIEKRSELMRMLRRWGLCRAVLYTDGAFVVAPSSGWTHDQIISNTGKGREVRSEILLFQVEADLDWVHVVCKTRQPVSLELFRGIYLDVIPRLSPCAINCNMGNPGRAAGRKCSMDQTTGRRAICRECSYATRMTARMGERTKGLSTASQCLQDCMNLASKTEVEAEKCPMGKW